MLFFVLLIASSLIIGTDSFLLTTSSSKVSIIIRSKDVSVIGAANCNRVNDHHLNDRITGDDDGGGVGITIEYCSACRWMLRANWIASELLTTFSDVSALATVTLIPKSPPLAEGGIFRICAHSSSSTLGGVNFNKSNSAMNAVALWDRKKEGCFPEAKDVKQRVRDYVSPAKDLGHSDIVKPLDSSTNGVSNDGDCIECNQEEKQQERKDEVISAVQMTTSIDKDQRNPIIPSFFYDERNNHISIEYSTGGDVESCDNGLYRATYYANELLSMTYERNSWWNRYQLQQQQAHVNNDENRDIEMPIAVDSVTLIPNRADLEILVSFFLCTIPSCIYNIFID